MIPTHDVIGGYHAIGGLCVGYDSKLGNHVSAFFKVVIKLPPGYEVVTKLLPGY